MMELIQAAIDGPVWTAIGVIVAAFVGLAIRLVPKTSSEAAVDMAKVRLDDATSWQLQVSSLREELVRVQAELVTERARGDALERRGDLLEHRVRELEAA